MGEVMVWKPVCQALRRTADVAGECGPLADLVHDLHGNRMNRQDGLRRLQCARVRRDDDAGYCKLGECHRGGLGLLDAERRQFRILDPRVHAGGVEMQIEITLSVAEQKHDASKISLPNAVENGAESRTTDLS